MNLLLLLRTWLGTIIFLPFFFGTFLCFHPVHVLTTTVCRPAFQLFYVIMNGSFLLWLRLICDTRYSVTMEERIPTDKPILFVSNHQSIFDIPIFSWFLRRYRPVFISKKELGRGIPSASLSLRAMNAALIDRNDRTQAVREIRRLAQDAAARRVGAITLFPEGTRAKEGEMKRFKALGFLTILREMPDLTIVPVAITGSHLLMKNRLLPVPFGVRVTLTVLKPVTDTKKPPKELLEEIEQTIRTHLGSPHFASAASSGTKEALALNN